MSAERASGWFVFRRIAPGPYTVFATEYSEGAFRAFRTTVEVRPGETSLVIPTPTVWTTIEPEPGDDDDDIVDAFIIDEP